MSFATVQPSGQCFVPANLTGPVLVYLTNGTTPLDALVTNRDLSNVTAGPTLTFLDPPPSVQAQELGTVAAGKFTQDFNALTSNSSISDVDSSFTSNSSSTGNSSGSTGSTSSNVATGTAILAVGVPSQVGLSPDGSLTVLPVTKVPA